MFAIIDCNNFYASCERLFRPDLRTQPIVVLSNNDGCVIARSNEAKALGIKMGQPFFQIKSFCAQKKVHVFSSNYTLYGDLSARVMQIIESNWPKTEIYSIDEAFLDLSSLSLATQVSFCQNLRARILQEVGIPTSIGIAPTKTLAKAANYLAKKSLKISVLKITPEPHWLSAIPIEEIWGIGRQWSKKLKARHIHTAEDLRQQSPHHIRQQFSLPLMQTTLELQGIICHEQQPTQAKKSITASRSFGKSQTRLEILSQAISTHCARATEKLREQKGLIDQLSVFIRTNPFQENKPQYANHCQIQLPAATDDIRVITSYAKYALQHIFKPNYAYQKVGIGFHHIIYSRQHSFLKEELPENSEAFMDVLTRIQQKYGKKAIHLAAEGLEKPWQMKSEQRSPHYTTSWEDLPIVRII